MSARVSGATPQRIEGAARLAFVGLFAVAAAHYVWNAFHVTPLTGYDAGAHAGYIVTLLEQGSLPHPYQGWSTFHPPVYYLLASAVWQGLEPLGPRALLAGVRALGGLGLLAAGAVAVRLMLRAGAGVSVAWVGAALLLFVPVAQMSTAMLGNEALATGIGALALPPLLALQRDPRQWQSAVWAALFAGLALATKYTGIFIAIGCVVPFLRRDFDRAMLRSLGAGLLVGAVVAGPVYVRNLTLTGVANPILRTREPTKSTEEANIIRPRRVTDYLWLDPATLRRPSVHHLKDRPPGAESGKPRHNPAMTNIWGLAYASTWYDAFAHRIPKEWHRDGVVTGPLLAVLGIVPTALMWLGFGLALGAAVRTRGRDAFAPLVAVWLVGLGSLVAFSWWAQSVVAVKASYLLPLAVPGALFFARGVAWLGDGIRPVILVLCALAAGAAALVFIDGLFFPSLPPEMMASRWRLVGEVIPESYIAEAVERLVPRR